MQYKLSFPKEANIPPTFINFATYCLFTKQLKESKNSYRTFKKPNPAVLTDEKKI